MLFRFTLSHTSGTEVLTKDPKGWKDTELFIKRDAKWHGLFFNFSTNLQFFNKGGGRTFIEDLYDSIGIDADIKLLVEISCNDTDPFEELFDGKLDLSDVSFERTYLECNIIQDDLTTLVTNRQNTKIDLSSLLSLGGTALGAFTNGPYDLTLHSKTIHAESEIDGGIFIDDHQFTVAAVGVTYRIFMQSEYDLIKNELKNTGLSPAYSQLQTGSPLPGFSDQSAGPFHDSSGQVPSLVPGTYDIDFDFSGDFIETATTIYTRTVGNITLELIFGQSLATASNTTLGTIAGYSSSAGSETRAFNFNGSTTIAMNPGDRVWLMWIVDTYLITAGSAPETLDIDFDYDTSECILSIDSVLASSTAKAFAIHEAFARIAQSITDQTDAFRSTIFGRTNSQPNSYVSNGCGAFTAVTHGYAIRKFLLTEHPVYMSLNDLFTAMNGIWNLGMGIEAGGSGSVIRVEKKRFFYDATVVLQIANIDKLKRKSAKEYFISTFDVGYDKWQLEDINLLDEFAIQHQYSTLKQNTRNNEDAICSFIASGYVIEFTRRSRFSDTTDWRYDSDNFVICLNRGLDSGGDPNSLDVAEKDENLTSSSGLLEPSTLYNVRISPKRNLLRWAYILGASKLKLPLGTLFFTRGEANEDIGLRFIDNNCPGDYNNVNLLENQSIAWDSPNLEEGPPVWVPEIFEFEAPLSFSDYKLLKANPDQTIEISETSTNFIPCFILEVAYSPFKNSRFTLLRSNL